MENLKMTPPVEIKNTESKKVKQEMDQSLEKISKTGLFNPEFLKQVTLIVFGKNKAYKYQKQTIAKIPEEDFLMMDFMQGKRTDFVGIDAKEDFEQRDIHSLSDKQFLPFMFFEGKLDYDEFVTHETAHNIFDIEYKKRFGEYQEKDGLTEISDKYKSKIKEIFTILIKKHYPTLEVEKFSFNRQQICEVFAMLYEREFCKRSGVNIEAHKKVEENTRKFINNPEKELVNFNAKHKRNCSIENFFTENHILSLIIAPLLEKEHSEFNDRLSVFWK